MDLFESLGAAIQQMIDAVIDVLGRIVKAVAEAMRHLVEFLESLERRSNGGITNGELTRNWGFKPLGWLARFADWRSMMWARIVM